MAMLPAASLALLAATAGAPEPVPVDVPLRIPTRQLEQRLEAALAMDSDGRSRLIADPCNALLLSGLSVTPAADRLVLTLDLEADVGVALFGACRGPGRWLGEARIVLEPAAAPDQLSVRLQPSRAELRRPDGSRGVLTRPSRALAERLILPRVADAAVDLRRPLEDLDGLLTAVLGDAERDVPSTLGNARLGAVAVDERGVLATLRFVVAPEEPGPEQTPPLDAAEFEQWQRIEDELDGFLTAVVTDLASRAAGDEALRLELLGVLLDSRIAIAEALVSTTAGPDPVRQLFVDSWNRLRPHVATLGTALGVDDPRSLRLASFVAGADAITAMDALGPAYGVEISRDGLRRLARLLLEEEAPASFTPLPLAPDAGLRSLFRMGRVDDQSGSPAPPSPTTSLLRRMADWVFPAAHAAEDSIVAALRELMPAPGTLQRYLGVVAALLDEVLAGYATDIPPSYRAMLPPLVRATAWKESCWRHYVPGETTPEVIRSPVGAVGMMQINGRVWRGIYDVDRLETDVRYNVAAGTEILEHYLLDYALRRGEHEQPGGVDNLVRATYAAYNGGPGQLARYRQPKTPARLRAIDAAFWGYYEQMKSGRWPAESSCYDFG